VGFGFRISGSGFQGSGLGLRVSGFGLEGSGLGLRVSGFGFRVSGFGVRIEGFEFRSTRGFDATAVPLAIPDHHQLVQILRFSI
jgi:hypothetical protein